MDRCQDKIRTLFSNRKLVIATKHKKEEAIAPVVQAALGVTCFVPKNFDTDALGTFTGETRRVADPLATAKKKCLMAMASTQCDLGIASEGSFGAHPTIFFAHSDHEILVLIDKMNGLEVVASELSLDTNFNGSEVNSEEELINFARSVKFPSHGLVLRTQKDDLKEIHKGITNWDSLVKTYRQLAKDRAQAYAETDMRAMYNPTRMKVIKATAEKLAEKIHSCCPHCGTPGFAITGTVPGLPCRLCGSPTRLAIAQVYSCIKCSFKQEEYAPGESLVADPQYCDHCNP